MTPAQLEAFDHIAYAYRASLVGNPASTGADEFAALVAHVEGLIAAETEACAKVCDDENFAIWSKEYAAAIRARTKP